MKLKITPSGQTIVKPTAPTAVPSIYSSARRRVSANFDNTSKIRAFGSVRIFGDDAKGLSFGTGRGRLKQRVECNSDGDHRPLEWL